MILPLKVSLSVFDSNSECNTWSDLSLKIKNWKKKKKELTIISFNHASNQEATMWGSQTNPYLSGLISIIKAADFLSWKRLFGVRMLIDLSTMFLLWLRQMAFSVVVELSRLHIFNCNDILEAIKGRKEMSTKKNKRQKKKKKIISIFYI